MVDVRKGSWMPRLPGCGELGGLIGGVHMQYHAWDYDGKVAGI
jgi:hypothetical protein